MIPVRISPFTLDVSPAQSEDLRRRLGATRWPTPLAEAGWQDGTEFAFLRHLLTHWQHRFCWPEQQARLNRLRHFIARIDGDDIHFVHQRGHGPAPLPLVLTHGWPGAFTEFERIIPLLTDPARHGGKAEDAFDVVVPSLPGFGFSSAPSRPGTSSRRVAQLWRALMHTLGYQRFGAQGGDIGAGVSVWLGRLYPQEVIGLHLNYMPASYRPTLGEGDPPLAPQEHAFLNQAADFAATEGAYAALQATRPQTLAFALTDSPVGLAAWIVEKFRAWSDCGGELERVISLDTLLTNLSLYWFSNSLDASLRIYKENRQAPLQFRSGERVTVPLRFARFPRELPTPPRCYVERVFSVQRWRDMPAGGHFAALERPVELAEEIRACFRPLRTG